MPHVDFYCQHQTELETTAAWSDSPPYPRDLIVLAIDARDSDALAHRYVTSGAYYLAGQAARLAVPPQGATWPAG